MVTRVDRFIQNVATYVAGRIKLIIALRDRYSLGCYAYKADSYVSKYGIPAANGCSPANDASTFYSNEQAKSDFVARLRYLLDHIHPHFGQRWRPFVNYSNIVSITNCCRCLSLDDKNETTY
jgi:hypothetical protein